MKRPTTGDYPVFFERYIQLANGNNALAALEQNKEVLHEIIRMSTLIEVDFSYAAGKWTFGQLLQHIIDTERIMTYRALCIARGELQSLPSFDENVYASAYTPRSVNSLIEEFNILRNSTEALFNSFTPADFDKKGLSNQQAITVNALAFIICGHVAHHHTIIESKYL